MKLDTSHMRYLTVDDFRVLQAVELGSRNHELVPTTMIHGIGGLKNPAATNRAIGDLAKLKLLSRLRNAKYDGFRITHVGYDYLALKAMLSRETLYSIGTIIGVGKESDIYSVCDNAGKQKVLKIHRLGRTSFRTVKNNRDYLRNRSTSNWMYLSRLAANKEYQFMKVLYDNGFIVPEPFDVSRHSILMEWIDGVTMKGVRNHSNYKKLYSDLMNFIVKLGNHGLIHCDFNEFNIIIRNEPDVNGYDFVVIDFPQCVSTKHVDAEAYFKRDVEGVRAFFAKKFRYSPEDDETMFDTDGFGDGYKYAYPKFYRDVERVKDLDVEVEASGYVKKDKKKEARDLEAAVQAMRDVDLNAESEEDVQEGYEDSEEDEQEDSEEDSDYDFDEQLDEFEDEKKELEEKTHQENEKIIEALSKGTKELKMDNLGNYILED